jgi:hypothetical protein
VSGFQMRSCCLGQGWLWEYAGDESERGKNEREKCDRIENGRVENGWSEDDNLQELSHGDGTLQKKPRDALAACRPRRRAKEGTFPFCFGGRWTWGYTSMCRGGQKRHRDWERFLLGGEAGAGYNPAAPKSVVAMCEFVEERADER